MDEKRNGITTDDFATWKGKKAAEAAGAVTEAKNVKEFRDNATQDYTAVNSKLTSIQTALDILDKDPDAAQAALQSFSADDWQVGRHQPVPAAEGQGRRRGVAEGAVVTLGGSAGEREERQKPEGI